MRDEIWFKHDARSRFDPKMSRLLKIMGMQGYGIFWAVIEVLHYQNDHQIHPEEMEGVADQLNIEIEVFRNFIDAAVASRLLKLENGVLFQEKLKRSQANRSSAASLQKMTMSEIGRLGGLASAQKRFPAKYSRDPNTWKQHQSEPKAKQSKANLDKKRIDIYASRSFSSNDENQNGNQQPTAKPKTVEELVADLPPDLKAARDKLLKIKPTEPKQPADTEA